MITQRPKGTQDWYGDNMHKRAVIEEKARNLCKVYNIKEADQKSQNFQVGRKSRKSAARFVRVKLIVHQS